MQRSTKTIASLILCLIVLASLCSSALAGGDNYVKSPSLIETTPILNTTKSSILNTKGENCALMGYVEVTSYRDRKSATAHLNDDQMTLFEEAYQDIMNRDNVRALCTELESLFTDKTLLVGELFDIHCTNKDDHNCKNYIVLDNICTAENFVALIHYLGNGKWEFVKSTLNGNELSFTVHSLSPFAIIVAEDYINPDSQGGGSHFVPGRRIVSQKTGDTTPLYFYMGMITVATIVCGTLVVRRRKTR